MKVVAATHDMQAGTRLRKADLKIVRVAENDLPRTAVMDEAGALDRILLFPAYQNEPLTGAKLTSPSRAEGLAATIEPGKRAISVQITDTSGVAGLVQPRSHVDVLFTKTGSMAEAVTSTILEDVTVLSVGRVTEVSNTAVVDPKASRPSTQAVTLLVTPEEARKIELAKNEGKVGLALRNPLDRSMLQDTAPARAEALNVDPFERGGRGRRVRSGPNVRDPAVWDQLTGGGSPARTAAAKEEPPKPRLVVDVFRGDKHVQEVFP